MRASENWRNCILKSVIDREGIVAQIPDYSVAQAQSAIRGSRISFFGLCFYLASQWFQIPLVAVGPSWAVWPNFPDIGAGLLLLGLLMEGSRLRVKPPTNRNALTLLLVIIGGTAIALLLSSVRGSMIGLSDNEKSISFGVFQLYRTVEFVVVFGVASAIPLTVGRVRILSKIVDIALLLTFLGIVGTYFSLISTPKMVAHLPYDFTTAGSWGVMSHGQWYEAGTIGYNHSYVAIQLIMLSALALGLRGGRAGSFREAAYLGMAAIGVFLSGSRSGMAAMLFFLVAYLFRKPKTLVAAIAVSGLVFVAFVGLGHGWNFDLSNTAERQLTLRNPLDPENLSGRDMIWRDSIAFLMQDPVRWIIGAGPGSVAQYGYNAHNLYLHITMEAGLVGLSLFCFGMYKIIDYLRRLERGAKPILWATVALLLSALTQETFYPVPAHGHFLGLYLCSLAIVISISAPKGVE